MPPRTTQRPPVVVTPAPAGGSSGRSLAALARMPTPEVASEVNDLLMKIAATAEDFAMIVDQHAIHLTRMLARPDGSIMDRARARRTARQVTASMRQGADRIRGGAFSMRACWARFTRTYHDQMNPGRKAFDFTK